MKELAIHHLPAEGGNRSRVRVSYRSHETAQAQERTVDFNFVLTEEQRREIQWYLEEYLVYPWDEFVTRAKRIEAEMEKLGAELFEAVFGNRETAALYGHASDDLANTRIVIHAQDPAGVALPWELMRDPARGEYGGLVWLARAFVRSQPDLFFEPPTFPAETDSFNILMVICRLRGEDDIPFQVDARPLLELFRPHRDRIRLDVLRPPTFERLTQVLSERPGFYHVLHFDGHGAFPNDGAGDDRQGLLAFEDEDGKTHLIEGDRLGALLAGKFVSLVVLNACQSGMTRERARYLSVGNQLLKAGVRGVAAMSYSVYVQSAVRFMARFYESLINSEEVSRATTLAREELRSDPLRFSPRGKVPLRDWVVPILFEAASFRVTTKPLNGLRLDPALLKDEQATAGAEIDCPEPPPFGFVGRDDVILKLERAFRNETVVLLEGMAGVGKTEAAMGFAR